MIILIIKGYPDNGREQIILNKNKQMKNGVVFISILLLLTSCVSKKLYEELETKYKHLLHSNSELIDNNEDLVQQRNALMADVKALKKNKQRLIDEKVLLEKNYSAAKSRLDNLIASYEALQEQSTTQLTEKARTIEKLLQDLEAKERSLADKEESLRSLQNALDDRSETIDELEALIQAKEAKMNALRNAVSDALQAFEGKGLTVTRKNGKVYVSMENKLLFASGSWAVGTQGEDAVRQLARVLVQHPDIEVLIEGHTDNVPYHGGVLLDNWDLSVKRATAIVRILQKNGVDAEQITAAGRSKYLPVAENTTTTGRAKNRRIEIILAPNLDKINELLAK